MVAMPYLLLGGMGLMAWRWGRLARREGNTTAEAPAPE